MTNVTVGILAHTDYITEIVSLLGGTYSGGITKINKIFNDKTFTFTISASIAPIFKHDYLFMIGTSLCDSQDVYRGDIVFIDNAYWKNEDQMMMSSTNDQMKLKMAQSRFHNLSKYMEQLCDHVKYNPYALEVLVLNQIGKKTLDEIRTNLSKEMHVTDQDFQEAIDSIKNEYLMDDNYNITDKGRALLDLYEKQCLLHSFSYTNFSFLKSISFPIKFSNVLTVDNVYNFENTDVISKDNVHKVHVIDTNSFHFLNACEENRKNYYVIKVAIVTGKITTTITRYSLQLALVPLLWFCDNYDHSE